MTAATAADRPAPPPAAPRAVGLWLAVCAAMVFAMVVLGGATRLTESGLSMTEWRPVTGWLPPMTEAAWQSVFDGYRDSPEFRRLNFWMGIEDFKRIFWLEYLHRLWGRIIGVAFALPLAWFWTRGRLPGGLRWRLAGLLTLGAAQGGLGWYMVQSGLIDHPEVSQYRLAAHLGLAFLIYGLLLWESLRALVPRPAAGAAEAALRAPAMLLLGWTALTVTWGALVAGIDAGLAYNTFPLMDGRLVPPGFFTLAPWWVNFGENTAAVQFTHRALGIGLALGALLVALRAARAGTGRRARRAAALVAGAALIQTGLGIATLLSAVALPLAIAHQAGAGAVLSAVLWMLYALGARARPAGTRRPNSSAPAT
ncbi:MAG: heme A synthase [Alphaproteobacteria bacterium]|nr:heme A synthase [Alphaproteobacteria bacterium]